MIGLRAVALALLVTLGIVGGVALGATQEAPSMTVQPVENSANYLGPNASDVDRSGQATASIDVAATVGANAGEVRSTFARVSVQREYDAADSPEARRRVVRNGTDQLEARVDALERREGRAIDRYASGDIEEADLFRTLASIDAEAEERGETARWLEARANELDMTGAAGRLATLRIRLVAVRGPVRDEITAGLDGSTPTRVHAEVAGGGLVLATMSQDEGGNSVYVREAYTPAIRNRRASDRYGGDFAEVFARLQEIYPWVHGGSQNLQFDSSRIGTSGATLYSIDYSYDHGRLTPYLDGGTGRVVKEDQRQRVEAVPTARRTETSDDGDLRVTIERTYASGPMGVNATDRATGQPANATVLVDGDRVGHTRGTTLWTVQPRGRTNVTVVGPEDTVRLEVAAS